MTDAKDSKVRDDETIGQLLEMMAIKENKDKGGKAKKLQAIENGTGKGEVKTGATTDAKSSPPSFGRLLSLSRPEWPALFRAVIVAILCIGVDLLVPEIRAILDNVLLYPNVKKADIINVLHFDITPDKSREIKRFIMLMLLFRTVSLVLGIMKGITFGLVGERVVVRMRLKLFGAMMSQELGFFDGKTSGELSSRLGPDSMAVQMIATTAVPDMVVQTIKVVLASVMMFRQQWELGLMVFGLIPLCFGFALPFMTVTIGLNKDYQDAIATSSNIATQTLSNIQVVRSCGGETFMSTLYGRAVGDPSQAAAFCWWPKKERTVYRIGAVKAVVNQFLVQGTIAIGSIGQQLISWYAYNMVVDSELTYGKFGAFMTYSMIVGLNCALVIKTGHGVFNAIGASQRIFEVVDRQPAIQAQPEGGEKLERLIGEVAFENVSFSYPARPDVQVLSGLSFTVSPKSKVAFVGESGSGKSTVLLLLGRLYDVTEGRVLVDKHDVRNLDAGWLRRRIGVVQQEPVLFGFSIRENIAFGRTAASVAEDVVDITDEDLVAAAQKANAHDFISGFPDGYDTLVGERGVRLSGGQKQRIAIARTVLCDPRVMLLDEATSALDSESEHLVQVALDRMMENRTVLVVAHRLSTVVNADQIMVMTKEGVVDSGKHPELLGRCEIYQELVKRQVVQVPAATEPGNEDSKLPAMTQTAPLETEQSKPSVTAMEKRGSTGSRASGRLDAKALENLVMMSSVNAKDTKKKKDEIKQEEAEGAEKPKPAPKPTLKFYRTLIRPEAPVLFAITFATLGCIGVEAWLPLLQGEIVDAVVGWSPVEEKKHEVARLMTMVLIINVSIQVWHFHRAIVGGLAGERVVARLRHIILRAILSQDMAFFDANTTGTLASRLTSDCQIIQAAAGSAITELFIGFFKASAAFGMGLYACWQLALLTLAIGPAMGIIMCVPLGLVIKLSTKYNDALARATHISTESTGSMRTVISYGAEDFALLLYGAAIGQLDGPNVFCWWPTKSKSIYRYGVQRAVLLRVTLQIALWTGTSIMTFIMWFAYNEILKGEITFGDVHAFVLYGMNIAMGLGGMAGAGGGCAAARAALQRIYEIYCRIPEVPNSGGESPADLQMDVRFESVSFTYPARPDVKILNDLSFTVPANSTAAFVGSSGSGKSTLLTLCQRFYDANEGRVSVGGRDVTSLDSSWLRRRIGIVQQEPALFGLSIRENIAYGYNAARAAEGGPAVADEDIQAASEMANAHKFVGEFPEGYNTFVGERGILLSGGQKQRVAIARALLTKPPILLLDEATSALDAQSEHLVQEAITRAMANRTVLIVAHRLSTVRDADQIHVLDKGRLVGSGTHEVLLKECDRYQELVKHQIH